MCILLPICHVSNNFPAYYVPGNIIFFLCHGVLSTMTLLAVGGGKFDLQLVIGGLKQVSL